MKKALSILLAALLLFSIAPVSLFASADDGIHKSGIWTYELDSKSGTTYAHIVGVDRVVNGKIEIPEKLAGYTVCDWDSGIFEDFSNYELVIPAGVPNKNYIDWILSDFDGEYPRVAVNAVINFELYSYFSELVSDVAANKITVASGNAYYSSKDGVLYDKNMTALFKYPICSDALLYELPASVPLIPSYVIDYARYANTAGYSSASDIIQTYPTMLIFGRSHAFVALDSGAWASGLTVHVSTAHFNAALSTAAQYANGFADKIGILALYLEFPFIGTATICTDYSDQTAIELLREVFVGIQSDEDLGFLSEYLPEVEKCSGHAPASVKVTSVSVASLPNKTAYNVGESFDKTGLSLNVTYSDGTTKTIASGFTCTGFSSDSAGTKTITVSYGGKSTTFTVTVQSNASMYIQNPSTNTINYGYSLTLHAQTANLPAGASVRWSANGGAVSLSPSGDSLSCNVKSVGSGSVSVTAQLFDRNGSPIKDASGNDITSTQYITSRAGFFQRIAYFFKSLFGVNMNIPQFIQEFVLQ